MVLNQSFLKVNKNIIQKVRLLLVEKLRERMK